jgi:hypothetical protein
MRLRAEDCSRRNDRSYLSIDFGLGLLVHLHVQPNPAISASSSPVSELKNLLKARKLLGQAERVSGNSLSELIDCLAEQIVCEIFIQFSPIAQRVAAHLSIPDP